LEKVLRWLRKKNFIWFLENNFRGGFEVSVWYNKLMLKSSARLSVVKNTTSSTEKRLYSSLLGGIIFLAFGILSFTGMNSLIRSTETTLATPLLSASEPTLSISAIPGSVNFGTFVATSTVETKTADLDFTVTTNAPDGFDVGVDVSDCLKHASVSASTCGDISGDKKLPLSSTLNHSPLNPNVEVDLETEVSIANTPGAYQGELEVTVSPNLPAAPTITSVSAGGNSSANSPYYLTIGEGAELTITGTNFSTAYAVYFGDCDETYFWGVGTVMVCNEGYTDIPCEDASIVSDTTITCSLPELGDAPGYGRWTLFVATWGGAVNLMKVVEFKYTAPAIPSTLKIYQRTGSTSVFYKNNSAIGIQVGSASSCQSGSPNSEYMFSEYAYGTGGCYSSQSYIYRAPNSTGGWTNNTYAHGLDGGNVGYINGMFFSTAAKSSSGPVYLTTFTDNFSTVASSSPNIVPLVRGASVDNYSWYRYGMGYTADGKDLYVMPWTTSSNKFVDVLDMSDTNTITKKAEYTISSATDIMVATAFDDLIFLKNSGGQIIEYNKSNNSQTVVSSGHVFHTHPGNSNAITNISLLETRQGIQYYPIESYDSNSTWKTKQIVFIVRTGTNAYTILKSDPALFTTGSLIGNTVYGLNFMPMSAGGRLQDDFYTVISGNVLRFRIIDPSTPKIIYNTTPYTELTSSTNQYIAITYNDYDTEKLYYDDPMSTTTDGSTYRATSAFGFSIGGWSGGAPNFTGEGNVGSGNFSAGGNIKIYQVSEDTYRFTSRVYTTHNGLFSTTSVRAALTSLADLSTALGRPVSHVYVHPVSINSFQKRTARVVANWTNGTLLESDNELLPQADMLGPGLGSRIQANYAWPTDNNPGGLPSATRYMQLEFTFSVK
jgi:hypothetical protein